MDRFSPTVLLRQNRSARLDEAIELLMDMVGRAKPEVALAALESLREFDLKRFTAEHYMTISTARIRAATRVAAQKRIPLTNSQHK